MGIHIIHKAVYLFVIAIVILDGSFKKIEARLRSRYIYRLGEEHILVIVQVSRQKPARRPRV